MAILTIGRLGFDVELDHPASWEETRNDADREFTIQGYIKSTITTAKYLRTELLEQQNQLVAVTYTGDSYFDGYFWLTNVHINSILGSYRQGLFPFELTLMRLGGPSRVELQSLLTYTTLENNHGLIVTEVEGYHGLPGTHYLYEGNANLGSVVRPSEDGNITVYRQVQIASTPDPTWGIEPSDFYDGAARIKVDGLLRAGLDAPNSPDNWELSNGIIKVTPNASAARIDVAQWDTSAYATAKTYKFTLDYPAGSETEITTLQSFNIIRNDPECSIVRVVSDAAPGGGAHRNYFDFTLRRGAAFVVVNWNFTEILQTVDMKVARASNEAATAVTPSGATSAPGIRATSNDGDGNRYVLATRHTHTQDTTVGSILRSNAENSFHFIIGSEINGSSAASGNGAAELILQYMGWVSEKVRAVLR